MISKSKNRNAVFALLDLMSLFATVLVEVACRANSHAPCA